MAQYAAVPAQTRSRAGAAGGPVRSRRALREPSRFSLRTLAAAAAGALVAVAAIVGLAAAPLVVLSVAAVVLCAAVIRRPSGRRSEPAIFIPTVVVWGAVVALLLALGAASLQGVLGTWTAALSGLVAQERGHAPGPGGTTAGSSPTPSSAPSKVSPSSVPAAPSSPVPTATHTGTPTASTTPSAPAAAPTTAAATVTSAAAPAPAPAASAAPAPSPSPTPARECRPEEEQGLGGLLGGLPGTSPDGKSCS